MTYINATSKTFGKIKKCPTCDSKKIQPVGCYNEGKGDWTVAVFWCKECGEIFEYWY